MIKIENVEVMGWEHAIRGIRNPMNSWEKSDSGICKGGDDGIGCENCANYDSCEHTYDHSWQLGNDATCGYEVSANDYGESGHHGSAVLVERFLYLRGWNCCELL